MKKILTILASLVFLTSCSFIYPSNNSNSNDKGFDPWDKLGGYRENTIGENQNVNLNLYKNLIPQIDSQFYSDEYSTSNIVDLSSLLSCPTGVSVSNNLVLVSKGGTYLFKGNFNGHIVVDKCNDEDVRIIFENVNLTGVNASAPLTFKKTNGKRILTIKDGTTSIIKDSTNNIGDLADRSIIEVKSCPFAINGKGKLLLNKVSNETSGIKANEKLHIIDTTIEVEANKHGIESKKQMYLINSNIKVNALGDGIRTDVDPISLEEGNELAKSIENGFLYIKNSNIDVTAGDDGIVSNSCLYIENSEKLIKIKTNGGCPSLVNEQTNNNSGGKGIKVDGICFGELEEKNQIPSSYKDNYLLIIDGGKFDLDCNGDGVSSKGNLFINDGEFSIATGDDALNSEYLTTIRKAKVNILRSYEGIEGSGVEIYDGEYLINSSDNAINAANSSVNYDYHLSLMGGTFKINALADGIDCNGWMNIDNASVYIDGPTSGMYSSIDNDKGYLVNSGNLIVTGPRGLIENPSSNSKQYFINLTLEKVYKDTIKVYENDQLIEEFSPTKEFQSVLISLKGMSKDKTYKVVVGNKTYEATLTNVGTALGVNSSNNYDQGLVS